jgi:hypothetical protein
MAQPCVPGSRRWGWRARSYRRSSQVIEADVNRLQRSAAAVLAAVSSGLISVSASYAQQAGIALKSVAGKLTLCHVDPHTVLVMKVGRKLWLGLMAGFAAIVAASAPASAGALPTQCIQVCYFTQSSTGGFTIEQCRRFIASRFYGAPPLRRFRDGFC